MLRVRVAVPGPQVASQFQPDHSPTWQFCGQQPAKQSSLSTVGGQSVPPQNAWPTPRERQREPVPHVTEQALHSPQAPTQQSCAQQAPGPQTQLPS
jgi:hypothetical protein